MKGERVKVEFADEDIKSPTVLPLGIDDINKRALDSMDMYVPASGKHNETLSDENTYFLRLDSENQFAKIHVSKANGEISELDLTLDGSNGLISLTDGVRAFGISTEEDIVHMKNEAGTIITAEGGKLTIKAEDVDLLINNKLNVEASTGEFKIENVKSESDQMKIDCDSTKITGSRIVTEVDQIKESVKKREVSAQKIINDTKLQSISGPITVGGIGFRAPLGMMPQPMMPNVSKSGMADWTGPGGQPLLRAQTTMIILTELTTKVDALGALLGIPPTAVSNLSANMSQMIAVNCKA